MEFLTTKQAAKLWGISPRRVALLCAQGRIPETAKAGKTWLLPHSLTQSNSARTYKKQLAKYEAQEDLRLF